MNPVVVRKEPLFLAGVSIELPPRSAPPSERPRVIQELWRTFLPKATDVKNRRGTERYSVIENDVLETGATPIFRAMIAVDSYAGVPAWCDRFTIEPGSYAVFEHKGPPRDLGKTVAAIQKEWSDKIPGLFQRDLEIMAVPQDYDPMCSESVLLYWVPL